MSSQDGGVTAMLREHRIDNCEGALADYIARQRWAGAQGRTIETTAIVDAAMISASSPVLLHTLTAVTFTDGRTTRYALPLGIRTVGDPIVERAPEFMIPWAEAPTPIVLYDAVGDSTYIEWLLGAIRNQLVLHTTSGTLRFSCPDPEALDTGNLSSVRLLRVEQSNTSVEVGDAIFLKHLRRVETGPSQELEMADALQAAGFKHLAPVLGRGLWEARDEAPSPLVIVQPFLHNSTEGWALALTSLRDLYANAESAGPGDPAQRRALVDDQDAAFLAELMRIGKVIAEMHIALASGSPRSDMAPARLTEESLDAWAKSMTAELDHLLARDDPALDPLRDAREAVVNSLRPDPRPLAGRPADPDPR